MNKYIKSIVCLLLAATMCTSCASAKKTDKKDPTEVLPGDSTETNTQENTTPESGGSSVIGPSEYDLRINEVLYENSVFRFGAKEAYSFVELYNYGTTEINLDGVTLAVGDNSVALKGSVAPGGYFLVFPGANTPTELGQGVLSLRLFPKCTISLIDSAKQLIQTVTLPELKKDISFAYKAPVLGEYTENEYVTTTVVTPGYENSKEGLSLWYQNNDTKSGLVINEAMNANREYLKTLNSYYDWIELRNTSNSPINLKDYYLSDKESNLQKWQLPDKTLSPGEMFLVFAENDDAELLISNGHVCCGFSLSADREQIYLSDKDGNIADAMVITGTTQNGSYGRMVNESGFFYFEKPTPG